MCVQETSYNVQIYTFMVVGMITVCHYGMGVCNVACDNVAAETWNLIFT